MAFGLSSCAVRRRIFSRLGGKNPQPLLTASKASLIEAVARTYNAVRDFNATVDLTPALGSAEKSEITEYKEVRGYIVFRKPSSIRIIGLYPVVRSTAFDMTSDGSIFEVNLPSKNRFVVGRDAVDEHPSVNKLENLRPQHFTEALLVRPIADPRRVVMENFTDEDNAFYILHELEDRDGQLELRRTIWFNRLNMTIARQLIFNNAGDIISDARYDEWKSWDNIPFPKHVVVDRPKDEYGVIVDIVKMDINKGVKDEQFTLARPEGSILQLIGSDPVPVPSSVTTGK